MNKKPRGYTTKLLAIDAETSGLFKRKDNPCVDLITKQYYQAVSWGMAVVDTTTFDILDELYLEIKWDGISLWDNQAQSIHGLSKEYLETNGVSRSEAVEAIGNLIINHWGPDIPVYLMGHNPSFDLAFLKNDLRSEGLEVKFTHRMIDVNSVGFTVYNTYTSDELYELMGFPVRTKHNSLEDVKYAVNTLKITRKIADSYF